MLVALMIEWDVWGDLEHAKSFAVRCKPTNLDAPSGGGWTALTYAASEGHLDILKALIAAGANRMRLTAMATLR